MNEGYTPDPKDIHFNVKDWGDSSEAIPPVTEPSAADLPLPPTPDNKFDFDFPEERAQADNTQKVVTVDAPAAATARPVDESNYTGRPEEDRQKHPELKAAWTSNLEDRRNAPKVGFGMEPVFIKPPAENPSDKFAFDDQPDAVISEPPVAADATKPVEVVAEPVYDPDDFPDIELDAVAPGAPVVPADFSSAVEAAVLAEPPSDEEPTRLDAMAQSPATDALAAASDDVLPFEMSAQERRKTEQQARKAQAAEVKGVSVGEKLGDALPIVAKVYGQSPEQAQKEKEQRISAWERRLQNNPLLNRLARLWSRYMDYSDKNQEKFGNKPKAPKA